jgi:hypothetical protein
MDVPPRPLHTWGLDLCGPLVPAKDTRNKYILTAIDHLTGWAEAIPIRDKTNSSVWEAYMAGIVSRYGIPEQILTDRGPEFSAHAFESFLKECGTEHRKSAPFCPSTNGRCERLNQSVKKILAKLVRNDLPTWEARLQEALWAYRSSVHVSIGMTPFEAVFGMIPRLPGQSVGGLPMSEHRKRLHLAWEVARKAQTRAGDLRLARRRGLKKYKGKVDLSPGDKVILKQHVGLTLQAKGDPGWVVQRVRGPVIKIARGEKTRIVNSAHLTKAPVGAEIVNLGKRRRRRVIKPQWLSRPTGDLKLVLKRVD